MRYTLKLDNASSASGAAMGRRNLIPDDRQNADPLLHLTKVRMSDGYDSGGAYWGLPHNLYCAEGEHGDYTVRLFVRAANHESAKQEVQKTLPAARFYR